MKNPVTGLQAVNTGTTDAAYEGFATMRRVPLDGLSNVYMTSEPINPLYTGDYAIAPYVRPPVAPSGSTQTMVDWSALPAGDFLMRFTTVAGDAANSCAPGNDGTESVPTALDPSGWQKGLLCSWQHNSWWSATVAAGHTWTFEVEATDETGAASTSKVQPVIGIWKSTDATGSLPTLASEPVAFNSLALGVTQVQGNASGAARTLRIEVGDQFGAGRPDFTYTARLLYVASVSPASVSSMGGQFTITGTGFREGNQVSVNGVEATVVSTSPTQIVAIAPALALTGAKVGKLLPVTVTDTTTGGTATMNAALKYIQLPNLLLQVSAPAVVNTGIPSTVPFAVRVVASDATTPAAGATVRFALVTGSAQLVACNGLTSCTLTSDSNGLVQTLVIGEAPGSFVLSATEQSGGATVQVTIQDTDAVRAVGLSSTDAYVAAGGGGTWKLGLNALQNGGPAAAVPLQWTASPELTVKADQTTASDGTAQVTISASAVTAGYAGTLTGCVWTTVCATWTVHGIDPSQWRVNVGTGAGQSVSSTDDLADATVTASDAEGHPLQGAPVQIYQRLLAWEGDCGTDRCASAPVLQSAQTSGVSDASGSVKITPLQMANTPEVLEVAVSTGTQGFLTFTLVKKP
jgi:hypothetical protein